MNTTTQLLEMTRHDIYMQIHIALYKNGENPRVFLDQHTSIPLAGAMKIWSTGELHKQGAVSDAFLDFIANGVKCQAWTRVADAAKVLLEKSVRPDDVHEWPFNKWLASGAETPQKVAAVAVLNRLYEVSNLEYR